jgi:hypothetical protein
MKPKAIGAMVAVLLAGWMAGTARADFILWYAEGSSVESMIVIRASPTSNVGIPLIEMNEDGGFGGSFKILKYSSTQFGTLGEGRSITPEPYVPDTNPNLYYWCYDDGSIGTGDYDFQDLTIRVTKNGDGTGTLFILACCGDDPEVWSPDFKTCYARTQDINEHHYGGKGADVKFSVIPEPATLSLLALLALSLPKRGGLALLRRKSGYGG